MDYVQYFQNKKGFDRFFRLCLEKYKRSGKVVGVVHLLNITEEEAYTLTHFFARKFYPEKDYDISIKEFMKVLQKGKFADFSFENYFSQIYENFTNETNKEKRTKEIEIYYQFLEDIFLQFHCDELKKYLINNLKLNNQTMQLIKRKYKRNKKNLQKELLDIDKLLCNIPSEVTYLPIYASLTSNPHYLDFSSSESSLFYRLLSCMLEEDTPKTIEDKIHHLEQINVYTDPLSNFVIVHNLQYDINVPFETMNLNILNIDSIHQIRGKNKKIFIFENPSILNYLKNISLDVSIIITSGMPNLAFYKLLEKISLDTTLYYNGDFDPEGLLIAEKIKKKYSNIVFFGYKKNNYYDTKPKKEISKKRLHKLENVTSKEFQEIKQCLLQDKKAGYQENQLIYIENYIKRML